MCPISQLPLDYIPERDYFNLFASPEKMNKEELRQLKLAENYKVILDQVEQPFDLPVSEIYRIRCQRENFIRATGQNVQNMRLSYFLIYIKILYTSIIQHTILLVIQLEIIYF